MTNWEDSRSEGFSKGVHAYYNHYADNADAKIGALFGINFALAGIVIAHLPSSCVPAILSWAAIALSSAAGVTLLAGIYPRVTSKGPSMSPIFWEDVKNHDSADAYARSISGLTGAEVEDAYATNNYFVASILRVKFAAIRIGIWLTAFAIASAVSSVIAR